MLKLQSRFNSFVNYVLRKMSEKLFHGDRGLQAEGSQREHSSMSDKHDIARDIRHFPVCVVKQRACDSTVGFLKSRCLALVVDLLGLD